MWLRPCSGRPPSFKLLSCVAYAKSFTSLCLRIQGEVGWKVCGEVAEGQGKSVEKHRGVEGCGRDQGPHRDLGIWHQYS